MSSTATYSEQRQKVLFKASREMRAIAAQILDDVQNEVECASIRSVEWAKNVAKHTALQANALEEKGHEQCLITTRDENLNYKSREAYNASIDAFEQRTKQAR